MAVSGHKAYTQAAGSIVTLLSTGLNALASATNSAASASHDNRTNLDPWGDFEINLGAQTARTGTPTVELYILRSLDETNFDTLDPAINEKVHGARVLTLPTSTAAYRIVIYECPIPPGLFQVYLRNLTSQALAATLNTVKLRTRSLQTL